MKESMLAGLRVHWAGGDDGDGGGNGPLVVLLHGYGAPGDDLVPLWSAFDAPGTRFLFPEGPQELTHSGRAWWDIDMVEYQVALMTNRARELALRVPEALAAAREKVIALLNAVGSPALPAPRDGQVVLGGFSQGAMLSMDVTLRTKVPLAGLILFSGSLVGLLEWEPLFAARRGLRVLQSHGTDDPILPFALAEELRDDLKKGGAEVQWMPFRGGHGIPPNVIDAAGSFLRGLGRGTEG